MTIEHFQCWVCEQPKHVSVLAWHEIKPGQMELVDDECWKGYREKKVAA